MILHNYLLVQHPEKGCLRKAGWMPEIIRYQIREKHFIFLSKLRFLGGLITSLNICCGEQTKLVLVGTAKGTPGAQLFTDLLG